MASSPKRSNKQKGSSSSDTDGGVSLGTSTGVELPAFSASPVPPRAISPTRIPRPKHQSSDGFLSSKTTKPSTSPFASRSSSPSKRVRQSESSADNSQPSSPTLRKTCLRDGIILSPHETGKLQAMTPQSTSESPVRAHRPRSASTGSQATKPLDVERDVQEQKPSDLEKSGGHVSSSTLQRFALNLPPPKFDVKEKDPKKGLPQGCSEKRRPDSAAIEKLPNESPKGQQQLRGLTTSAVGRREDLYGTAVQCACDLHASLTPDKIEEYEIFDARIRFFANKDGTWKDNVGPIYVPVIFPPHSTEMDDNVRTEAPAHQNGSSAFHDDPNAVHAFDLQPGKPFGPLEETKDLKDELDKARNLLDNFMKNNTPANEQTASRYQAPLDSPQMQKNIKKIGKSILRESGDSESREEGQGSRKGGYRVSQAASTTSNAVSPKGLFYDALYGFLTVCIMFLFYTFFIADSQQCGWMNRLDLMSSGLEDSSTLLSSLRRVILHAYPGPTLRSAAVADVEEPALISGEATTAHITQDARTTLSPTMSTSIVENPELTDEGRLKPSSEFSGPPLTQSPNMLDFVDYFLGWQGAQ